MSTLTIRLPEDTARRLKALASARGVSLNKLIEELSTAALASYDAETRFRAMAAKGNKATALEILARLDREDKAGASAFAGRKAKGLRPSRTQG